MTTPASPARRRLVSAIAGLGLAVAATVATFALASRPGDPPAPSLPGDVVLESTVSLAAGAVDRRLLAPGSSIFDVEVTTAESVVVTFGPPAPATRASEAGPAPETATRVGEVAGGAVTGSVRVYAAGIQVLRVEPTAPRPSGTASIRVRRRAGS